MQKVFTGYLLLNLALEGLAAITLIGGALGVFSIDNLEAGMWPMHYGFAAIAIATAVFWVWPQRTKPDSVAPILGILLSFHALVSISFGIAGGQVPAMVVHGFMAALALYFYSQRARWCDEYRQRRMRANIDPGCVSTYRRRVAVYGSQANTFDTKSAKDRK
jgi:hypothetical protein